MDALSSPRNTNIKQTAGQPTGSTDPHHPTTRFFPCQTKELLLAGGFLPGFGCLSSRASAPVPTCLTSRRDTAAKSGQFQPVLLLLPSPSQTGTLSD